MKRELYQQLMEELEKEDGQPVGMEAPIHRSPIQVLEGEYTSPEMQLKPEPTPSVFERIKQRLMNK